MARKEALRRPKEEGRYTMGSCDAFDSRGKGGRFWKFRKL